MTDLGIILTRLGLDQYHDALVAEGFDTWETVLDVQESDLDALGFKRGHRRKLQREIAKYRGISNEQSLGSPVFAGSTPAESAERAGHAALDLKRRYRRHPKPDPHAPQRPISSYVEFSNQVRNQVREQNLSFTEIAKVVGDRWQKLTPQEKEPYESRANAAKERYFIEMAEYKNTEPYTEYLQYLADFRAMYGGPVADPKRPKLEQESGGGSISTKSTDVGQTLPISSHPRVGSISTVASATFLGNLVSPVAGAQGTTTTFVVPCSTQLTPRLPHILPGNPGSPTTLLLQEPRIRVGGAAPSLWAEDQASMREQPDPLPRTAQLSLLPSVNQVDEQSPPHSAGGSYSSSSQDMRRPPRIRNPVQHQQSSSSSMSSGSFISNASGSGISTQFPDAIHNQVRRPQPSDMVRPPAMEQGRAPYGLMSLPPLIPLERMPGLRVDQSQWTLPLPITSPGHERQHGLKSFSGSSASPATRQLERPRPGVDSSPNNISVERSESEAVDALTGQASGTHMRRDSGSVGSGKKYLA